MEIRRIILGAFGYVFEYKIAFAKALLIPILILLALGAIPFKEPGAALLILLIIISIFIYSVLAITTHRIILLGPESVSEFGVYLPRKRELSFILYSIGIGLCVIPFGLLALIPAIGWLIALASIIYILARLSLVLPAIATDKKWSFLDSWKATKNHQILMMVVVAIFPFVISIPEMLLSHVPHIDLLVNFLSAVTMVFVVAALSVAFQVITEKANKRFNKDAP